MRMAWKIFLILICLIITGCTTENEKMISENTESESVQPTTCTTEATTEISTEKPTEEKTEIPTNSMTESTSTQEESTEAMLWYYMTTEEKWAYRFIRRYEMYGNQKSLLYDIDHDGYMELILRSAGMWDGCYYISIWDIFEDSINFDKGFSPQLYDVSSYHEAMKDYFLPFSLYYDSDKNEYFYFGEGFGNDGKHPIELRVFERYNIGETVCVDEIAHYYYDTGEKSEGENIYILKGETYGGQVIEEGFYPKSELYQMLGIEDYLSKYELISDSVFEESDWKPLKDRQKDLAECAKNYPVTIPENTTPEKSYCLVSFFEDLKKKENVEGLVIDVDNDGGVEIMIHTLAAQEQMEKWDIYSQNEGAVYYWKSVEVERPYREFVSYTGEIIQLKPQWYSWKEDFETLFWHSFEYPRERGITYNASGTDIYENYLINGICIGMYYEDVQKVLGASNGEATVEWTDDGLMQYEYYGESKVYYLVQGDIKRVQGYVFVENLVTSSENQIHIGSTRNEVMSQFGTYIDYDQGYGMKDDGTTKDLLVAGKLHYGNISFHFDGDVVIAISAKGLTSD